MRTFWLILGLLIVAVIGVNFFLSQGNSSANDQAPGHAPAAQESTARKLNVSVIKVEPVRIDDMLALPGKTQAYGNVLVSAETGGNLEWLGIREGQEVKKGELLAKIDPQLLQASLDRAQASYDLEDKLNQRRQKLYDKGLITAEDLDRSQTSLSLAEGQLRQARVQYQQGFVRAPISGRINELWPHQGEFVDRGKPLAQIVDSSLIEVYCHVPEMDVRFLETGQECKVTFDALPDREFTGAIDFVAFEAEDAAKTFLTRLVVENPQGVIRPGMIARVSFLRQTIPEALTAPLFALVDKGGERLLFLEKDGKVLSVQPELGILAGAFIQIKKGLKPGDRLIVAGQHDVEQGMDVDAVLVSSPEEAWGAPKAREGSGPEQAAVVDEPESSDYEPAEPKP